jgi:HSP20 family protein
VFKLYLTRNINNLTKTKKDKNMRLTTNFDRFLNDSFFNDRSFFPVEKQVRKLTSFNPIVDIYENDENIVINAELPGLTKEAVSIDLNGRVLTISGERKLSEETDKKTFYKKERFYGNFKRSFTLPEFTDQDKINAEFLNGVLEIKITKPEEVKPKQIAIH